MLSKIDRVAKLKGVEVVKVNPAWISVIGALKYAPQLGIDKDIASVFVIGRRALGLKEEIPDNYLKLLSDREYLEYAIYCYEEKERELKEKLKRETNQYKKNSLNFELRKVQSAKKVSEEESLQSEPRFCDGTHGRNSERGLGKTSQSPWQVLKVAFFFPVLGKVLPMDLSPLKPILMEGVWDRVKSRLVPLEVGGTSR